MFRLRNLFLASGVALIGTAVANSNGFSKGCEASSYGACFRMHARYRIYTGDGQVALWPVGTHRLLGVVSGDEPMIKCCQEETPRTCLRRPMTMTFSETSWSAHSKMMFLEKNVPFAP